MFSDYQQIRVALNNKAGEKGQRDGLDEVQHAILQIEVNAVHISDLYGGWLAEKYPFFHLIFIPPGCTPVAQILDLQGHDERHVHVRVPWAMLSLGE